MRALPVLLVLLCTCRALASADVVALRFGTVQGCTPSGTELGVEAQIPSSTVAYYYSKSGDTVRMTSTTDAWGLNLLRDEEVAVVVSVNVTDSSVCQIGWLPRSSVFPGREAIPANVTIKNLQANYGLVGVHSYGRTTITNRVRCVGESGSFKSYEIYSSTGGSAWLKVSALGGTLWMVVASTQGQQGDAKVSYSGKVVRTAYPETYPVTYLPGAYGAGGKVQDVKVKWQSLFLRQETFTRTGWRQRGWLTEAGTRYALGGVYKENKGIVFYPEWTDKPLYLLSFKAGPYGTGTGTEMTLEQGSEITLPSRLFTREGYTQIGWVTSGGEHYAEGGQYSENGNETFYPNWVVNHKLTYSPGDKGTGAVVTEELPTGCQTQLREALFTRNGYTQSGWVTATGTRYGVVAQYTVQADETFYPTWRGKGYVVTYEPGQYGSGERQTDEKIQDVDLTLPEGMFTRSGYVQTGWHSVEGGVTFSYSTGVYTRNAPVTLYPTWTSGYRVTYDPGTDGSGTSWFSVKGKGKALTLDAKGFARTGYRQSGWQTSGGTKYKMGGDYSKDAAVTLYPVWVKDDHQIKYIPGAYSTGATNLQVKSYGVRSTLRGSTYLRKDYVQLGWRDVSTKKIYALKDSYESEANVILEPTWGLFSENHSTVRCLPDDHCTGVGTNLLKGYGMSLVLPEMYFRREGYVQTGWTVEKGSSANPYPVGGNPYAEDADVTLYPHWTAVSEAVVLSNVVASASGGSYSVELSGLVEACYCVKGEAIDDWVQMTSVLCHYRYYELHSWNWPDGWNDVDITLGHGNQSFDVRGSGSLKCRLHVDANTSARPRRTSYVVMLDKGLLYAVVDIWQPGSERCTVSFDANGGAGSVKAVTADYGQPMPAVAATISRTGYSFEGFYDAATGGIQYYTSELTSARRWDRGSNVCLVARWKPLVYSIRYEDLRGADNDNPTTYRSGEFVVFKELANFRGCVFEKWVPSFIGQDDCGNKTVRAVWREVPTEYAIRYHLNDGRTPETTRVQTVGVDVRQRLLWKDSQLGWKRNGYAFVGWGMSAGSTVAKYANGDFVTNLSEGGVTNDLYAIWRPSDSYVIAFHVNTNGTALATAMQWKKCGAASSLAWCNSQLGWTRDGYVIAGWATSPTGKAVYANGQDVKDLVSSGSTVNLYAVWKRASYTVKFNKNDGSGKTATQRFETGIAQRLKWKDSGLGWSRNGYAFEGWATAVGGVVEYDNGEQVRDIAAGGATLNLYAVWRRLTYTVRFHRNDGSGTTASQTIGVGETQRLRWKDSQLKWSTPSGWAFLGWAESALATVKKYENGQSVKDLKAAGGTVNLYAVWKRPSYKIVFDKNDASYLTATQTLFVGVSQRLTWKDSGLKWTNPPGWTFRGWATTEKASAVEYANGAEVKDLTGAGGELRLYAVWRKQSGLADLKFAKFTSWPDYVFLATSKDSNASAATFVRGETFYVRCAFGNYGEGTAAQVDSWRILLDAKTLYEETAADKLSVKGWRTKAIACSTSLMSVGSHTLTVILNPERTVAESEYGNNEKKITFTITAESKKAAGVRALPATATTPAPSSYTFNPGLYRGTFADGSGAFSLLVDEFDADGVATAYLVATTEDGSWSEECEATVVGETLMLEFGQGVCVLAFNPAETGEAVTMTAVLKE